MALSEKELARLIPDRSGFRFVDCPNCEGGAEENQLSWSIEDPDRVFCQFCNMRFPNEAYPENGVMRVTNPRGEVQEYPYWEAPFPPPAELPGPLSHIEPDRKYRHYFRAKGWYVARMYFSDAAYQLGQALPPDREIRHLHAERRRSWIGSLRSILGIAPGSTRRSGPK